MPDENRIIGERYRLLELIGQGSAADVWRAHDLRLARDVALKLYRGDAAAELGGAQEEVRMLARLDHPNLVSVLDTGTEPDGTAWIVTSYVDGQSLAALLAHGALPAEDVGIYGAEVAAALSYVHGQGLVHRDVKPGNVLVGTNGRVYLTDFGIARIVDSPNRTVADTVVGTPAFFAPEQVSGARVGPPADVYALGLLLLESLTGHREFPGAAMESAVARLHRDPVIPAHLSPPWRSLLAAMTTREPADRPTAAQVERRLRTLADPAATIVAPLAGGGLAGEAVAGGLAGGALAGAGMAGLAGDHTAILPPVRPAAEEYVYPPVPRRGGVNPAVLTLLVLIALAAIAAAVYLSLSGRRGTPLPAPATSSPAPTSAAPTSPAPTTPVPTTPAPTSAAPTTPAPTTPAPTSPAPTSVSPAPTSPAPSPSPPVTILPSSALSS